MLLPNSESALHYSVLENNLLNSGLVSKLVNHRFTCRKPVPPLMPKIISPQVEYATLLAQVKQVTPEIFTAEGGFLNLMEGRWQEPGNPR